MAAALPLGALLMDGHWGFFLDEGANAHLGTFPSDTCWDPEFWRSIQILPGLCVVLTVPVGCQVLSIWRLGADGPAGGLAQT